MLSLSTLGPMFLAGIIIFGPLFYFLFYAHDIFGLPKWLSLIYVVGVVAGFVAWPPIASITVSISWLLVIGSWIWIIWNIFKSQD